MVYIYTVQMSTKMHITFVLQFEFYNEFVDYWIREIHQYGMDSSTELCVYLLEHQVSLCVTVSIYDNFFCLGIRWRSQMFFQCSARSFHSCFHPDQIVGCLKGLCQQQEIRKYENKSIHICILFSSRQVKHTIHRLDRKIEISIHRIELFQLILFSSLML